MAMLFGHAVVVIVLAAQPSVQVRSPYLDAVRRYGPGTEREAIVALRAVRLRDADQVFEELDAKVCAAVGARGCAPKQLIAASRESQAKVAATWRRLYPRALALHVEALAACDPTAEAGAIRLHRAVLIRLIARIDLLAREHRDIPAAFAQVAVQGRRLLLWTLQYLRDLSGLEAVLGTFEAAQLRDVDVRLARGALEEWHTLPEEVARLARADYEAFPRDRMLAQQERQRLDIAAKVYEALLVEHPAVLEAHLRLARLELRLGRAERAEAHLVRVAGLEPDARQAYLAALFLADVHERQGRIADAIAAYGVAQQKWPGAQTPGIAVARLRGLAGAHQEARDALTGLRLERATDAPERSDPWMGYIGAQAWRLPSGVAALQATFEAEP
jgi:tetratricopeptide (TPR) repeat protein